MMPRFAPFAVRALAVLAVALPVLATSSSTPAPDFTLPSNSGKTVNLSQFKGQVVMINFWASWCVPCRQEMPLLEDIYKKYKPMGFTMLGVNVEPDSKDAEAWLGKLAKPVSWNAGAGPDEEAANAGSTNTSARASPFATRPIPLAFSVRADILLTPSEKDGRAEQGFDVVGDLVLA